MPRLVNRHSGTSSVVIIFQTYKTVICNLHTDSSFRLGQLRRTWRGNDDKYVERKIPGDHRGVTSGYMKASSNRKKRKLQPCDSPALAVTKPIVGESSGTE